MAPQLRFGPALSQVVLCLRELEEAFVLDYITVLLQLPSSWVLARLLIFCISTTTNFL